MASSKLTIRKAFEARLKTTFTAYAQTVSVNWPDGDTFDGSTALLTAEPSLHMAPEAPKTMGPTPRVQRGGHYLVMLALKSGQPEDLLDDLVQHVLDAFPYSSDLTAGGDAIQIDGKSAGASVPVDGWVKCPVDIQWSINI